MALTLSPFGQTLATLAFLFDLIFPFTPRAAIAEIVFDHQQEPTWISNALESGALDQMTIDLMRRSVTCHPEECPAAWARAVSWLKKNSQRIEILPDIANNILKFKSALGDLKH